MKSTFAYTPFVIVLTLIESISAQPLGRREASKPDVNKCLRANNLKYGWVNKTDAKVPPCWIENGGKYDCYEYKSGKQCDKWPGMFDITKGSNKPETYKSTDPSAIYLTPQQLEEGIKGLKTVFEILKPENPQNPSPLKLNGPKLFQAREYLYSITHLIHPEKQNDVVKNDPTAIVFEGKILEEIQKGYKLACEAFLIDDKDHDGKVDELSEVVIDWDKLLELTKSIDVANQDLIAKSKGSDKPKESNKSEASNEPKTYKSTDPSAIYLTPQQLEEGIKGLKTVFEILKPENPQNPSPLKLNGPKLFQAREYLYSITHLIHPEKQNDVVKNDPTAIVFEGKILEEIQKGYKLACEAFLIDDKDHDGKVDELSEVVIDWDKLLELTKSIDVANQDLIAKSKGSK